MILFITVYRWQKVEEINYNIYAQNIDKKRIKFKKDKQLIKVSMNLKQLLISESLISVDILNKVESGRPISGIQTVIQVVSGTSWFIERQVFSADLFSSLKLSLIK